MWVTHHIGLEIAERSFRLVEMKKQDSQMTILRADALTTGRNYASGMLHEIPFDRDSAKQFITELAELIGRDSVLSGGISIVLPANLPVVTTVHLDPALDENQQHEQLQWECRTLGGFGAETEMHILSHKLQGQGKTTDYLAVALPKATVRFLASTMSHLTFELSSVDANHFVIENWVRQAYPFNARDNFTVLGMFNHFCAAGAYAAGEYLGFRMQGYSYREESLSQAERLLNDLHGNHDRNTTHSIYMYGEEAAPGVASSLHELLEKPVSRIAPLTDTRIPEHVQRRLDVFNEHTFDVAVCAAARGLT